MFKKGDISGNEISMCIGRVASITSLKVGITKKNALRGLGRKFILVRMDYVDKTSASKNTQREAEKKLVRKNDGMRDFII